MSQTTAHELGSNVEQDTIDALNDRAERFIEDFASAHYEMGHAQNFIRGLCEVYELNHLLSVEFEHRVTKVGGSGIMRVDGFFPGLLLVEMKSTGKDLDEAYLQAKGYIPRIKNPADRPRHILVSDFKWLHLYDEQGENPPIKFELAQFRQHVSDLAFLAGFERELQKRNEAATKEAAERLGRLHDEIKATGYLQDDLQTLLVRLLFCLFADDTGLFGDEDAFHALIQDTRGDGDDFGGKLDRLFTHLNTKDAQRKNPAAAKWAQFPYINGNIFERRIQTADFTHNARQALLSCCELNWADISPDIFGNLFQHIMHWDDESAEGKSKKRRDFGAHYTSERNILRAIRPLFIDPLSEALYNCGKDKKKLNALHAQLREINVLDPACGCGNFLVVAYRELRHLEAKLLEALEAVEKTKRTPLLDVDQFYGIEIDPTAAEIATVAMWLTDHQLNLKFKVKPRIPLDKKAQIHTGNALRVDWGRVIAAKDCRYIVGNPPFIGHQWRNTDQVADMAMVWGTKGQVNRLDYVSCWHKKAANFMQVNPEIQTVFVSTNSITQGEQAGILWGALHQQGVQIQFAHRTFRWSNDGTGVAAVHCVIVGFLVGKAKRCVLWDYSSDLNGDGKKIRATRINSYLTDAPFVVLPARTQARHGLPKLHKGSQPTDGGFLVLSEVEANALIESEPKSEQWIRPYIGGEELIQGTPRYCLWLKGATTKQLKAMPQVWDRVQAVAQVRELSPTPSVQAFAEYPALFTQDRQPDANYLALPEVSSENREFLPVGFLNAQVIASNQLQIISQGTLYHFAVLCSTMHNAWMRTICGRMKSDYRYSPAIYNNFPWLAGLDKKTTKTIETAGKAVLKARAVHKGKSLAWLYNLDTMPQNLKDAHETVDEAVDAAFEYEDGNNDAQRVAFLFKLYKLNDSLLPQDDEELADEKPMKLKRKAHTTTSRKPLYS